jgi:hypothetical protein
MRVLVVALALALAAAFGAPAQGVYFPGGGTFNTLRSGTAPPANSLGINGDFYIDSLGLMVYGPKAAGVWPAGVSMSSGGGSGTGNVTGSSLSNGHLIVGQGGSGIGASSLVPPNSAIVGITDTQTLTNKSIASTEITGLGTLATGGYPSAGIVKSSGSAFSDAALADIIGLWTDCSAGFLKFDGTCDTPGGSTYTNGAGLSLTDTTFAVIFGTDADTAAVGNDSRFLNATSLNGTAIDSLTGLLKLTAGTPSAAAASDVIGLFGSGSCSGLLRSDGTCFPVASAYTNSFSATGGTPLIIVHGQNVAHPFTKFWDANGNEIPLFPSVTLTTLSGSMDSSTTTAGVTAGTGITNGDNLTIGSEILTVTAGGGTGSLTVTRGAFGTTAASHSSSANVIDMNDIVLTTVASQSGTVTVSGEPIGVSVGGAGTGVSSFNARLGDVVLGLSDVTTALGFTPLKPANNLSEISSASTARTNLGLGTAATQASSAFQTALGFTPLNAASNLSDLGSASTARTNLGLGALAVAGYPSAGVIKSSGTAFSDAAAADIVGLFASGSCSGFLKSDGTCSATNVTSAASLTSGNVVTGAGTKTVQDSGLAAPTGAFVGTSDTQTLTNKSIAASEVNSGTFAGARMPAYTGDVAVSAGATTTTLATVNTNVGTYGDSTHTLQVTVDGKGRITAVSPVAIAGGGGGTTAGSITSGGLAGLPASCTVGDVYFATDQPAGQQLYDCSATDTWTQIVSIGPSGALAYTGGSLDVNTAVVPLLASANVFPGLNTFSGGLSLPTTAAQPTCSSTTRGYFWIVRGNGTSTSDSLHTCILTSSGTYSWHTVF